MKILLHDGWNCLLVDFREFEQLGEKRGEWLKLKLEELYKLSFETHKKIHFERRLEILQHSFIEMEYLFEDRKYKDMKIYKERVQQLKKEVIENYKKKEEEVLSKTKK